MTEPPVITWEENGQEFVIVFDAIEADTTDATATLSTHPVMDVADHKHPGRDILTLEARVTNSPLGDVPASGLGLPDVQLLEDGTYSAPFDRVRDVAESLFYLARRPILVQVSTAVKDHDSLSIVSVSAPKTDSTDSVRFTIVAEQVRIATTLTVAASALPREDRGSSRTQTGAAEGETDQGSASSRQSRLRAIQRQAEEGGFGSFVQSLVGGS